MNDFLIGTSRLNATQSKKFFFLKPGNNIYRVLPPIFSLAAEGKFSKFHKIHRGFRDTKNWQKSFLCVEVYDAKTKTVTTHCPSCDAWREAQNNYNLAKQQNADKDQLAQYRATVVQVFQPDKNHCLNVINLNNEIGVLSIPHKSWLALMAELKVQFDNGFDPTGEHGCFLNFQKTQQYVGDPQTGYSVTLAVEMSRDQNNQMIQKVKMHELTSDIVNRLKTEAFDLDSMYPSLTIEQVAILVQLDPVQRATTLEKFLSAPTSTAPNAALGTVPGTDAKAVITPVMQNGQFGFQQFGTTPVPEQPAAPAQAPVQTQAPVATQPVNPPTAPTANLQNPLKAPVTPRQSVAPKQSTNTNPMVNPAMGKPMNTGVQPTPARQAAPKPTNPLLTPQAPVAPVGVSNISDEEFADMFMQPD